MRTKKKVSLLRAITKPKSLKMICVICGKEITDGGYLIPLFTFICTGRKCITKFFKRKL